MDIRVLESNLTCGEMWKKEMAAIWKPYLPPKNGEEIAHNSAVNQNSGEASQAQGDERRLMEPQLAMQEMQEADARFSRYIRET